MHLRRYAWTAPAALLWAVALSATAFGAEPDAAAARSHIVKRVIAGVASGRKRTVYVDFLGRPARGRMLAASDAGIEVSVMGQSVKFAWGDLSANRFYGLAKRYADRSSADDLAALAVLAAEAKDEDGLSEQIAALRKIDAKRAGALQAKLRGSPAGAQSGRPAMPRGSSVGSSGRTKRLTAFTVTERAGLERRKWPVASGIPLPPGAAPKNAAFSLSSGSGGAVPAQFEITGRWWMDGSPRWVLVNFQTDLAPRGSRQYVLSLADRAAPVETPLKVTGGAGGAGSVTVVTGPLKFTVRAQGFNIIENVCYDPAGAFGSASKVVGAHKGGAVVRAGGKEYRASGGAAKLTVEERGPMRAVIRAEGSHLSTDGSRGLDYVARIHAYSEKSFVRVEYTFMNRQGRDSRANLRLEEVSLQLPTTLATGGKAKALIGGARTVHSADAPASIRQTTSDEFVLGGAASGTVKSGKSDRTQSTGWGALTGRGLMAGAAVRWFWQNHPKEMAVSEGGELKVGLFKGRYDIHQGVAKTHDVYLHFGKAGDSSRLAVLRRAVDYPLVAVCPPRWYCRDTRAFGQLTESDPSLYTPKGQDILKRMDEAMRKGLASMISRRDGNGDMAGGLDEFGIWDFGDDCQPQKGVNRTKATTYWNNNYYCFPHAMILGFARTGDEGFLEHAQECARHLGDLDISHYDPRGSYGPGAPRICPGLQHYRSYMSGRPEVHNVFNHLKNQSLYDLWYLRGDRRAREVGLMVSDHVVTRHNIGGADPGQARSVAHGIFAALEGFKLTHDRKYLDAAKRQIEIGMEYASKKGGGYPYGQYSFMAGLMSEAYRDYYYVTHDPKMPDAQVKLADWMIRVHGGKARGGKGLGGSTGMCTPAMVQAYAITGKQKYLDMAFEDLDVWTLGYNGQRDSKHFAQSFKSSQYVLHYLTKSFKAGEGDPGPWPKGK